MPMHNLLHTHQPEAAALKQLQHLFNQLTPQQHQFINQMNLPCYLNLTDTTLSLCWHDQRFHPFSLDYCNHPLLRQHAPQKSLVAKACLAHKHPVIWDLTGGWGLDSLVLAHAGATVVTYEQHPLIGLITQFAHWQLNAQAAWAIHINTAESALASAPSRWPDVLYLDPMFPPKAKGRLAQKSIQILTVLCENTTTTSDLLNQALTSPVKKIVLKSPRKSPTLQAPHHLILGKSIKWHVYQN